MSSKRAAKRKKPGKRAAQRPALPARSVRSWRLPVAVGGLCLLHFLLAVTSVRHKSNTYDEIAHLTRGYSYVLADDFRLGPPHPPLAHYWAALPGLGLDVKFPPQRTKAEHLGAWNRSDMWAIGRQFFYYQQLGNAAVIDTLLFRGRAMIALLSAGLGIFVFVWGRRLFGNAGGVIALAVFAFSPTMLAHGRLVTTDCAAAFFFMCSLTAIWRVLHRVSVVNVALGAGALAGLFLSKLSAVLIIPVGLILLIIRLVAREPLPLCWRGTTHALHGRAVRLACLMGVMLSWIVVTYIAIWAAYGFRYSALAEGADPEAHFYTNRAVPEGQDLWAYVLRGDEISERFRSTIHWLRDHRVFPEAYIYSAAYAKQTARGRMAFLDGAVNIKGFTWFFPACVLYKTPLPLFALLLAGMCVPLVTGLAGQVGESPSAKSENHSRTDGVGSGPLPYSRGSDLGPSRGRSLLGLLYASAPLWVFFIVYWFFSMRSSLNIGHRHVMPTYPMLFVFCGSLAAYWRMAHPVWRAIPVALVGLFAAASLWCYPHYLTYFNTIAGGPERAYHHLVDSSLDWGQDLPGMSRYLAERRADGEDRPVYFSYFGSGGRVAWRHYRIEARSLPLAWPKDARGDLTYQPGLYAISATNLQQVYSDYRDWTDERESAFQRLHKVFAACMAAADTPAGRQRWTGPKMVAALRKYQRMKFAKLCAGLREREPDDHVNHSILIYHLDRAELAELLGIP
jgi:4-amino-4-deoxy-L-arabinose transferase-like glycosyltransferase